MASLKSVILAGLGRIAWWLGIRLAALGVALGMLGAVAAVIAYMIITPREFDWNMLDTANRLPGATFIDAKGDLLATRGAYHADDVALKELPPYLVDSFLATEDRRFFNHWGLDPRGILRAMITNVRLGYTAEGGSTITQQLAKNLFLSNDRTMTRKLKEVLYAIWLERHLEKHEILELYLNRIYFGAGTYGVDAAARFYFDVPAAEVSLSEAAMLAGLPKAPTKLSPTNNLASAQTRAGRVLDNLVEADLMSEADVFEARVAPAILAERAELGSIQYYLDYVYENLYPMLHERQRNPQGPETLSNSDDIKFERLPPPGADDRPIDLGTEDLIVYTTLDTSLQRKAEASLLVTLERDGALLKVSEGALVAIDPDGAVRAMVGGRSYIDSQFNRATQAMRQPGSAFKPFVYLAALENGYSPDTILEDAPLTISTPQGDWSPSNYSDRYRGRVTMREALAYSLNTAAVRVSEDIGPEKVVEVAHRMGIQSPIQPNPSIPLGTDEVNLLELTGAFLPFARTGLKMPVHTILRVENADGLILYEHRAPKPERIVDKDIATNMTNMMYQVIHSGTGRAARLGERPAAGKTGTSQDWRDAWFLGYTKDLITGVWVGNDDDSPMNRVTGGGLPAIIWKDFMTEAHEGVRIGALPGAFPTRDNSAANELKAFYGDLSGNMRAVQAGRAADDPPPRDTKQQNKPRRSKPRWWPF